jgi:hypothetical protein
MTISLSPEFLAYYGAFLLVYSLGRLMVLLRDKKAGKNG